MPVFDSQKTFLLLASFWLLVVSTMFGTHGLIPVDETRYLAVAWEMWFRGEFLVPHLDGQAYSHKPPLLFWLFHMGWAVFGVNEWWPRLVPALLSLASISLTLQIAKLCWPKQLVIQQNVAIILFSSALWLLFTTLVMFDMLLTFCTLVSILGGLQVWRSGNKKYFAVLGLGIGLGVLAKGPVILLHTLPPLLLAPWWMREHKMFSWTFWYLGILVSILIGAGIALTWAVPAGMAGGEEYRNAIFWGQTAGRMVNSFAHQHPFWWYLPWLPVLFFPWLLWPKVWRGAATTLKQSLNDGMRFCIAWFIPVLIAMSLVSGKQVKYLLPIMPALALMTAFFLSSLQDKKKASFSLPTIVMLIICSLVLYLPYWQHKLWTKYTNDISPLWSLSFIAILFALPIIRKKIVISNLATLACLNVLLFALLHWTVLKAIYPLYDLSLLSKQLQKLENAGYILGHAGPYHGQYHFLGKLKKPIDYISGPIWYGWIRQNKDAYMIVYYNEWDDDPTEQPFYFQEFRSNAVAIWHTSQMLDDRKYNWPFKVKNQ